MNGAIGRQKEAQLSGMLQRYLYVRGQLRLFDEEVQKQIDEPTRSMCAVSIVLADALVDVYVALRESSR